MKTLTLISIFILTACGGGSGSEGSSSEGCNDSPVINEFTFTSGDFNELIDNAEGEIKAEVIEATGTTVTVNLEVNQCTSSTEDNDSEIDNSSNTVEVANDATLAVGEVDENGVNARLLRVGNTFHNEWE